MVPLPFVGRRQGWSAAIVSTVRACTDLRPVSKDFPKVQWTGSTARTMRSGAPGAGLKTVNRYSNSPSAPREMQMGESPMMLDDRLHGPSAFISKPSPENTAATWSSVSSFPASQRRVRLGHGFVLIHMNRSGRTVSSVIFQSAGIESRPARESMSAVTMSSAERTTRSAPRPTTNTAARTIRTIRFTVFPQSHQCALIPRRPPSVLNRIVPAWDTRVSADLKQAVPLSRLSGVTRRQRALCEVGTIDSHR